MNKVLPVLKGPIAVVLLGNEGLAVFKKLEISFDCADFFLHNCVEVECEHQRFSRVFDLTKEIFSQYKGIVYIMPTGVVTRAIAPLLQHKLVDPAVVVVDVLGRWAISHLSGHEGGANKLAEQVGWIVGAEPIITTTTDAAKDLIVGVGCRRGTPSVTILKAIRTVLSENNLKEDLVRVLASIDIKSDEVGIHQAAREIGCGIRFISSSEIKKYAGNFEASDFVMSKVGVSAVCGPASLLAGSNTCLIVNKQVVESVTVAVSRELFTP